MALPKQPELDFQSFALAPLHILYLMSIHQADFDKRLHMGHFSTHAQFAVRIRELINLGLVKYDGQHCLTMEGLAHVEKLLAVRVAR